MFNLANWVAIVSVILLVVAFAVGINTRPGPEFWPRPLDARGRLPPIIPFAPGADFAGEHKYGLWTLYCRQGVPGAEAGSAPAAPATPDLGAELEPPGVPALRCLSHARIQVRIARGAPRTVAAFNVLAIGPEYTPFVVIQVPAKAKSGDLIFFQIDENLKFQAPVTECSEAACFVKSTLPQAAMDQMLQGKELRLRLTVAGTDKPADFAYPLHGFKDAYQALKLAQPPPVAAAAAETPPASTVQPVPILPPELKQPPPQPALQP